MWTSLLTQALLKFFSGVILVGILIFLPAGSFSYWQGWLLMGILFVPMSIAGLILMVRNPELLRKRLNGKENEAELKTVVALSGVLFIAAFIIAGLSWRYGWLVIPDYMALSDIRCIWSQRFYSLQCRWFSATVFVHHHAGLHSCNRQENPQRGSHA